MRADALLMVMQCCRDIYGALLQLFRIEQKKNTVYLNAERYTTQLNECESALDGVLLALEYCTGTIAHERHGGPPVPAVAVRDIIVTLLHHNPDALNFWDVFCENKVRMVLFVFIYFSFLISHFLFIVHIIVCVLVCGGNIRGHHRLPHPRHVP